MASSSAHSAHVKRFHGADVRKGFMSHLHNYFASKGITTFKDQEIERGHTIGPELVKAIRESRVSIVLLSENYASSSWCLDELVEILKCKHASGQIVMPIFYDVDPSHVRKQKGEFRKAFEKTCEGKTEKEQQRWIKTLGYVATIAGEHSRNWTDEAAMVEKLVTSVSNILNVTPSRDFDGVVGMEAHFIELYSLLCLECDDVKMIGIWGPAGIDELEKLDALARERSWFGFGSRVIVTTQDTNILKAHGINDIYHVDFPSKEEAVEILCLSAFKQNHVRDGFEEVASKVAELCGNLPLGLCVVGSSLRGESKNEWELQLSKIESSLDRKIEDVLRVGYDKFSKKDQSLFLHIACIFNDHYFDDGLTTMLADSNLDVENGLKTLAVKSLVQLPYRGTGSIIGILLNMSKMSKFSISGKAFEGMRNLRFLRIYGESDTLRILGDIEYLPRLRLLQWKFYPRERLPPTCQPECLVELHMPYSKLEKLWDGVQPLPNLKEMDLSYSFKLKEIPNLSEATNLEKLTLMSCTSLVELPSSIRDLHKQKELWMTSCKNLRVIPKNINLASLERVEMNGCSQLRTFPDFSSNTKYLDVRDTKINDVPASVVGRRSCLDELFLGNRSLTRLTHVPESVRLLYLRNSDIKKIPDCVIGLPGLEILKVQNCRKLVSLQGLPLSLVLLDATECGSLKSVCFSFYEPRAYITPNNCKCVRLEKDAIRVSSPFYNPRREFTFLNCLSLSEEARKVIIRRWDYMCVLLPGKKIPAEFTHRATGNSLFISQGKFSAPSTFTACLLLSPAKRVRWNPQIFCRLISNGVLISELLYHSTRSYNDLLTEHLLVFSGALFKEHICLEEDATTSEIQFEFICAGNDDTIIKCGVQILMKPLRSQKMKAEWREE
ncbi:unnamed protein product [Microthlaspi erraticum]|uniref:ADP-ribosyl cyclase/cyclic ADP-ribose hydrolase n=1 Tax=Microthlaspi erraticum TaxID=1685480 RepID=A0A6D2J0P7_9BRAS|nr:unnamed protein product [Microthlaspi erraticum]